MEDHCSLLNWPCYQDEGIEDLRHQLLYTAELETAIVSAKEEIARREIEIFDLKNLLSRTVKERNEAQIQIQKLFLDKLSFQQQLLQNHQQQEMQQLNRESASLAITYTSEDESKASDSNNHTSSPDSSKVIIVPSQQFSEPIPQQSSLPEAILKLAAHKPLPEKGKLLRAVKEAGPLLQTLFLAGPLPQWQHPPPQLDSIEIPPVAISSSTSRQIHPDSFNSFTSCLSKKRDRDLCEGPDSSSPTNKYQKVGLH
ncbi:hypothetical protein SADUNF_Sadunf10G0178300 [Salix dunnii]|uniref:Uncharacterized protein n=1 Tax=Salix dunnii TaxID=1413687 RepID=A0A835JPC7_9ROSI|nr:hypothetical protein SADUNF_Sadunf10G0178300 [Salix dunnii]